MQKENVFPVWKPEPDAERIIQRLLKKGFDNCLEACFFQTELLEQCGIRFRDIVDYVVIPDDNSLRLDLLNAGWIQEPINKTVLKNPRGFFPAVVFGGKMEIAFKVEHIADFLKTRKLRRTIFGKANAPLRKAMIFENGQVEFWAVERNGFDGYVIEDPPNEQIRNARIHLQNFRSRRRQFDSKVQGFDHTDMLIQNALKDIGKHWACSLFLKAEREYWESRNYAGRLQKSRQNRFGIGWANQDHHTYDSSREWFYRVIKILETLGFECRERFYAGAEAGWGSQILEQPVLGSIVFADIDLAPHELQIDFAHQPMDPLPELRRAGLWTELHGESMLESGLNHLECMFDQKKFREIFSYLGIKMMKPFSDFPYLYQELTIGEWWPVNPEQVNKLEKAGLVSHEQAEDFRLNGAIGSHFENLERNYGYKGFNQPGIDNVLRIIDPRKNLIET